MISLERQALESKFCDIAYENHFWGYEPVYCNRTGPVEEASLNIELPGKGSCMKFILHMNRNLNNKGILNRVSTSVQDGKFSSSVHV